MKPLKIRFLLTGRCTATCAYCHNEGQSKPAHMLPLATIRYVLDTLHHHQIAVDEIILSGGEPTLHKELGAIAALCATTSARVSMNTHGGHPDRLSSALPFLHEIKLHVDSFNEEHQLKSMGIPLRKVQESIALARKYPINVLVNHPVLNQEETRIFVQGARELGVDCKLIDLFQYQSAPLSADQMPWHEEGYTLTSDHAWKHNDTHHHIYIRQCDAEHQTGSDTLFIGTDGVRRHLDGPVLGFAEGFDVRMLGAARSQQNKWEPVRFHTDRFLADHNMLRR